VTGALDEAAEARPGEAIDGERLRGFLGVSGPVEVRQLRAGHSNPTYLVTAGGREMVLRRARG
jgi:aminoglycoside phosphotransferase (APT) family kinase protein